jgi:DUF971 family protein
MSVEPTKLFLAGGDLLEIEWSDGKRLRYNAAQLRRCCPCATCRSERAAPADAPPAAGRPKVIIEQMTPVGNYAYKIRFSDGHDTGIYPLELLRELGRET